MFEVCVDFLYLLGVSLFFELGGLYDLGFELFVWWFCEIDDWCCGGGVRCVLGGWNSVLCLGWVFFVWYGYGVLWRVWGCEGNGCLCVWLYWCVGSLFWCIGKFRWKVERWCLMLRNCFSDLIFVDCL